ncbi:MAG: hypothetical protein E2O67_02200 [Deltaproteobacteria bacterium]|nr:MAG: hypothetical protein E2O67_02200 [Deltaproteobacteria bacterium]
MEYILITLIVLGITIFICYPFFTKTGSENLFEEDKKNYTEKRKSDLQLLEENKLELYSAIKEIEFDHGLGKLTDEDYKELRESYIYEAAKVVRKIEELSHKNKLSIEDKIEQEIRNSKNSSSQIEDGIEQEIKKHRNKKD